MKNCIEYKVNEGCLTLLLILENMYISEMIQIPKHIYKEIETLYEMLVNYIEKDYKYINAENIEFVRKIFINKEK